MSSAMSEPLAKPRLVIVFPDEWLAYAPTILNLVRNLFDAFTITILTVDTGQYDHQEIGARCIYVRINLHLGRLLEIFGLYKYYKAIRLLSKSRQLNADVAIGVDSVGLWVAQRRWSRCHFLSLEAERDHLFRHCRSTHIESVIIQTKARYRHLFKDDNARPVYFIQNAPAYDPVIIKTERHSHNDQAHLIYFGNVIPRHGIYFCLDAILGQAHITLTLKGRIKPKVKQVIQRRYWSLLQSGRLILDEHYLDQDEVVAYLSKFSIGFCLYDFNRIKANDFNYLTVPSGKLFSYYAAGVPVIGNNIPGLKSVDDFQAGILINDLSASEITATIQKILSDYQIFKKNCIKAAQFYDFDKAILPFKRFLISNV
jgi:glycosyltransferase involved in cell wall biosynthesis